jgi:hypothetical protein
VDLNSHQIRVLTALRGASVLTREPGTLTPDGHQRWFSIRNLTDEGRLTEAGDPYAAEAAEQLRRGGLAARKTYYSHPYYSVTEAGLLALAAYEAEIGMSEIAACQLAVEQTRYDIARASRENTAAERALEDAYRRYAEAVPS